MDVKVVAWNMHQLASNWDHLLHDPEIAGAQAYLLCEARSAPPDDVVAALDPLMQGSTKETACPCVPDSEGRAKCDHRTYSTAIAAPGGVEDPKLRPALRVGTWIAGRVHLGALPVTAIAVYGLGDPEYPTYWESTKAAMDEVIAILPQCGDYVLIGGDFNIIANREDEAHEVLESLRDRGFTECLDAGLDLEGHQDMRDLADLGRCDCGKGERCRHTRTFYPSDPAKRAMPYQDDYLFASEKLAPLLQDCWALPVGADSPSDHAPIIAVFDAPEAPNQVV